MTLNVICQCVETDPVRTGPVRVGDPVVTVAHAGAGRSTRCTQRCRGCPDVAQTLDDNARGGKWESGPFTGPFGKIVDTSAGCFATTFRPADAHWFAGYHTRLGTPQVH